MGKYIEIPLSGKHNAKELSYREDIQAKKDNFEETKKWVKHNLDLGYFNKLRKIGVNFKGNILELGAGHCWFSAEASKLKEVKKVYALEFSRFLIKEASLKVLHYLNAQKSKIIRVRGDFYDLSYFKKNKVDFDFIVFDAALHHADYPLRVLNEVNKILKKNGSVICIREPVIPIPFLKPIFQNRFGRDEKPFGVSENTYSLKEWNKIFSKAGFKLKIFKSRERKLIFFPREHIFLAKK